MTKYLLSIYQPDGPPPATVNLERIMRDVGALTEEMQAAGAWVFAGGLHEAGSATEPISTATHADPGTRSSRSRASAAPATIERAAKRCVAYQARSLARVQGVRIPSQKLHLTLPITLPVSAKNSAMPVSSTRSMARLPLCAAQACTHCW